MSKAAAKKAAQKAAKAVAAAYRSTLGNGSRVYGSYPEIGARQAEKDMAAMIAKMGEATLAMHRKSPKKKRTKQEKAARKRVLAAHKASAARAARLPGKKKRVSKKKASKRSKVTTRRAAPPPAAKKPAARRNVTKTVTADAVVKAAANAAVKRWLCEGARRSGCGAGGSRVVTGSGSFKRMRPMKFMTAS